MKIALHVYWKKIIDTIMKQKKDGLHLRGGVHLKIYRKSFRSDCFTN